MPESAMRGSRGCVCVGDDFFSHWDVPDVPGIMRNSDGEADVDRTGI